jgi:hypothetical protein
MGGAGIISFSARAWPALLRAERLETHSWPILRRWRGVRSSTGLASSDQGIVATQWGWERIGPF